MEDFIWDINETKFKQQFSVNYVLILLCPFRCELVMPLFTLCIPA